MIQNCGFQKEVKAKTSVICEKLMKQKQITMNIWIKLVNLTLRNFIYKWFLDCPINLLEEIYYCCFFVYIHKIQFFEFL